MSRVVITDYMGDDTSLERELLTEGGVDEVVVAAEPDPASWAEEAVGADALLTRHAPVRADTIARLRRCRIIARYGTGHDNIDLEAAARCGITVTNVPDYCTEEVAEHAFALVLAATRYLPTFLGEVQAGGWTPHPLPPVRRLAGSTLALFGCGRIGAAVAARAQGFAMTVRAFDPYAPTLPAGVERAESVDDLVTGAAVLSLHAPLTPETEKAVDARVLAALPEGAIVVNVARGPLLDLDAAHEALASGHLGALALDVLDEEPPPPDHPLRQAPGALLTPHVGYFSTTSVAEAKRRSCEEILRVLAGERPAHPVLS